jgi:hypothetical protein
MMDLRWLPRTGQVPVGVSEGVPSEAFIAAAVSLSNP